MRPTLPPTHDTVNINFGHLARAAEGLTQWRPLLLGAGSLLLAALLCSLGMWLLSRGYGIVQIMLCGAAMCVAMVVVVTGISAVGVMLMDKAQQLPVRGFSEAAIFGLMCLPKFLLLSILATLAVLAFLLVASIIYLVCKIPVLGPAVALVAHPLLIVIAAVLSVVAMWVIFPLFAPAVWSGLSTKQALISVIGIARSSLVSVVIMQLVVYFIVALIGFLIAASLLPASASLTTLATSIISSSESLADYGSFISMNPWSSAMGMVESLGGSSSITALLLGGTVLTLIVAALMVQVMIMGLNLVYVQAREQLHPGHTEQAVEAFLSNMQQRASEAKTKALAAAEHAKQANAHRAREAAAAAAVIAQPEPPLAEDTKPPTIEPSPPASTLAAPTQPPVASTAPTTRAAAVEPTAAGEPALQAHCPQCHAPTASTDRFCGECGHQLLA